MKEGELVGRGQILGDYALGDCKLHPLSLSPSFLTLHSSNYAPIMLKPYLTGLTAELGDYISDRV